VFSRSRKKLTYGPKYLLEANVEGIKKLEDEGGEEKKEVWGEPDLYLVSIILVSITAPEEVREEQKIQIS